MNMTGKAAALAAALALALTGCHSSFTQGIGGASIELSELDGTTEGAFELPYADGAFDVELESGTVDVEILDAIIPTDDDGAPVPLDTILEVTGLADGAHETFADDDGDVYVRVTGHGPATGTIRFSADD